MVLCLRPTSRTLGADRHRAALAPDNSGTSGSRRGHSGGSAAETSRMPPTSSPSYCLTKATGSTGNCYSAMEAFEEPSVSRTSAASGGRPPPALTSDRWRLMPDSASWPSARPGSSDPGSGQPGYDNGGRGGAHRSANCRPGGSRRQSDPPRRQAVRYGNPPVEQRVRGGPRTGPSYGPVGPSRGRRGHPLRPPASPQPSHLGYNIGAVSSRSGLVTTSRPSPGSSIQAEDCQPPSHLAANSARDESATRRPSTPWWGLCGAGAGWS